MSCHRHQLGSEHPAVSRDRRRPFARGFARKIALFLGLVSAVVGTGLPARSQEPEHPFHFGFSTALMPDVNEDDASAAMKVWAEGVVKNGVINADPHVLMFHDFASLQTALRNKTVDGVVAPTAEYFALTNEFEFNHFVFSVVAGSIFDEYILLVRAEGRFAKVEDLRGCTLNSLKQTRTSLAPIWLDTLLLEKGLPPAAQFCGRVTEATKLTQTVLPVFFGKADACLVTRTGFNTMCELNPQVGRQLRVLAASTNYVPSGFFFRAGYPPARQEECLAEFKRVGKNPAGLQILTVFQTESLEEQPASVLNSTLDLLKRHRQLLDGWGQANGRPDEPKPDIGKNVASENHATATPPGQPALLNRP